MKMYQNNFLHPRTGKKGQQFNILQETIVVITISVLGMYVRLC